MFLFFAFIYLNLERNISCMSCICYANYTYTSLTSSSTSGLVTYFSYSSIATGELVFEFFRLCLLKSRKIVLSFNINPSLFISLTCFTIRYDDFDVFFRVILLGGSPCFNYSAPFNIWFYPFNFEFSSVSS